MERPLTGEPLAVDLVNTRWRHAGAWHDALATVPGVAGWLAERGLDSVPDERMRAALVQTRSALQAVLQGEPDAEERLNAVLTRGLVVHSLQDGRVRQHPVFTDQSWALAWQAADDYLRLRYAGAETIRQCEHPSCVLYFYDPTGRRRWCSMAGCGNRAKAQRHYARQRRTAAPA
jgi:predicted RNA-binding Zn ribbon-like protein